MFFFVEAYWIKKKVDQNIKMWSYKRKGNPTSRVNSRTLEKT